MSPGTSPMVEPRGDAMDDGALERLVVQDRRHQERRELRLAPRGLLRFGADAREQRIVAADADQMGDLALRHDNLLRVSRPTHATMFGRLREAGSGGGIRSAPWEVLRRPRPDPRRVLHSIPEPVTSRIAEEMPPAESPEIDRTARTRPAMGSANRSQYRISKFPGDCVWRDESASDEIMGRPLFGPLRTLASSILR